MAVVTRPKQATGRGYPDLREHLDALERAGLLVRVRRAMSAETEVHPLVRWQYRGGLPEEDWRAFLFEDVRTVKGGPACWLSQASPRSALKTLHLYETTPGFTWTNSESSTALVPARVGSRMSVCIRICSIIIAVPPRLSCLLHIDIAGEGPIRRTVYVSEKRVVGPACKNMEIFNCSGAYER